MPVYQFNWNEFITHKARGGTIRNFENKTLLPLSDGIIHNHPQGAEDHRNLSASSRQPIIFRRGGEKTTSWSFDKTLFLEAIRNSRPRKD